MSGRARPCAALATLAALLAGCTVGPDYKPPEIAVPPAYAGAAAPGTAADLTRWWQGFGDPMLDWLVSRALAQGLDVQAAASRIRQARLAETQARAAGLPQIDAMANATHIELSKNAGLSSLSSIFGGGGTGGTGGTGDQPGGIAAPGRGITTYAVGFDASWELDLFGGVARQREAAAARTEAAVWDARDTAVSLAAEVASGYVQLRRLQAQEAVRRADIARATRALQLSQHQAEVGLVPTGDTIRQRATIAQTAAGLSPIVAEELVQIHALGLLIGRSPEELLARLTPPAAQPPAPPAVPPGLPSDLLRRRPDIRAAERRLAAATADIGVATADLYPRFSLTGMVELISTALRTLISTDSLQAMGTAGATFPVLDFGRRRATLGLRREDRVQAYIDYQRTVLSGLRDVEDALARIDAEGKRNATLRAGLADAARAVRAVDARYAAGLVDLSAVLDAQASELSNRDQLAESDGALRRDLVSLYKALGGGWRAGGGVEAAQRPDMR